MFGKAFWLQMLPFACMIVGAEFKSKDTNNVGKDDRTGDIIIAAGTAVSAALANNDNAFYRAVQALRDAADAILQARPTNTAI